MIRISILLSLVCLLSPLSSKAEGLNGNDIVRRADEMMIGDSAEYENVMVIKRPNNDDLVSKYKTYFKERGQKVLVRILYPPREVGKDLLLIGDDMWQYIPNVERSVRIAGSQRFMGGEFNNTDLLNVSLVGDYNATIVDIIEIEGIQCYYLELKALKATTTYDRVSYWVRVKDFIPFREEYVTLSGKKMKSLTYSDIGPLGNRIRPRKLTMVNSLRPANRTRVARAADDHRRDGVPPDHLHGIGRGVGGHRRRLRVPHSLGRRPPVGA